MQKLLNGLVTPLTKWQWQQRKINPRADTWSLSAKKTNELWQLLCGPSHNLRIHQCIQTDSHHSRDNSLWWLTHLAGNAILSASKALLSPISCYRDWKLEDCMTWYEITFKSLQFLVSANWTWCQLLTLKDAHPSSALIHLTMRTLNA